MEATEPTPRRWLILIVLCLSTLVLVVDNMVLAVAIPPLTEELKASAQDTQWILDSYILVFAGLLLTSGSLGDRFGRRKIMIIGLLAFGVASLVATFAGSPGQLIGARVLMGIGGALIMPSTLSILITVFDDKQRPKAMAAWSGVAMVGLVSGPVLGGALINWFWWGAVFVINVPIVVLALAAAILLMPESKGPWQKPDPLGAVLSVVGMTALVWTIIELPKHGLTEGSQPIMASVAVVSLAAFVIWESRIASPMVPLRLFRDRNFSGGSLSLTLMQIGNGGLLLIFTQYLQFVLGYSPTKAGLAFVPMAVAALAFNTIGATLGQKIGNRAMVALGLLTMTAGLGTLASVSASDGFLTSAIGLAVLGAGGGLAMPAAIAALMGAVPTEHAGVGSALNDTIQQMSAALGVAILGSVLSSVYTGQIPGSAPDKATESIGDALTIAAQTGDTGLAQTARDAFTSAMSTSLMVGAAAAAAGSLLALLVIRRRKADAAETVPDTGTDVESKTAGCAL